MAYFSFRGKYMVYILLLVILAACSRDEPSYPEGEGPVPQVVFLFSPGGLGDMSYNDCILEGLQRFRKNHPEVDVFMSSPASMEVAERIFTDWLKRPGSDIPVVFVLASSDYEVLADRYVADWPLAPNKRLLLFESMREYPDPGVTTFQISMYGASYIAGRVAREFAADRRSLVLIGSSSDGPVTAARDGFIDGLGTEEYDVEYLADDWTGFVMADATYRFMSRWSAAYGFIFPVAGGSNAGIYRYTREFADAPYLAGMDIDQSGLSSKITGSVVKRLDVLVEDYLSQWLLTGEMPSARLYGLESGYADWLPAPRYAYGSAGVADAARDDAITGEKEYFTEVDK